MPVCFTCMGYSFKPDEQLFVLHFLLILRLIKTASVMCGRLTGLRFFSDFQAVQNLVRVRVNWIMWHILVVRLWDSNSLIVHSWWLDGQIDLETQVLSLRNSCLQRKERTHGGARPPWLCGCVPTVSWLGHPPLGGNLVSANVTLWPVSAKTVLFWWSRLESSNSLQICFKKIFFNP